METTPALLAQLVLDGKADRHSPARLPAGVVEQPLEQSLGAPHCEALTDELHRRLQRMCSLDASAVDVQELCTRVEDLCQWRWPNPPIAARFFWTAGWLNELVDRSKSAIDFYDAFLLMPSRENHLRLLALNNRGVLRIRLGRLDGVEDLARAGIADCRLASRALLNPPSGGLPAACFNLLNLINASFGAADLLRAVDEELTEFFSRLPADLGASWLGESDRADFGLRISDCGLPPQASSNPQSAIPNPPSSVPPILRDPTYRRLNTLVTHLAAQARPLMADSRHPADRASSVFRRLSLWDCRLDGAARVEGVSPLSRGQDARATAAADRFVEEDHQRYAEAANLLLSDDVPSLLTKPEGPLVRVEQAAQEELALIEGHLASGQYELAKSRLQVQRRILSALNGHGVPAALLARVDAQIERVAHLEAQEGQLKLQRTCAGFVAEVERFCTLADGGQARRALEGLNYRLQQFRAPLSPQADAEVVGLLDELAARSRRHLHELERAEIGKEIADPWQHVQKNWPSDGSIPVPDSVQQALTQCRLHDPQGWMEDWAALQERLDVHQGQYYVHKALSALQSNPDAWEQTRDDLVQALRCDPDSWPALAPAFGLTGGDGGLRETDDANPPSALRPPPLTVDHAGWLLERAFQRIGADAGKCVRLWQAVERTLAPALAGGDVEALAQARILAERCRGYWPVGVPEAPGCADPRHPVNRFLEAWEKARGLVEAQRLLEAQPPQLDQAEKCLVDLLRSGLDTRGQLQRVVTELYLVRFHEKDAPPVQRSVLAGLEDWVRTVPQEQVPQMREQEIVEETERVRMMVAEQSELMPYRERPDEPATNKMKYL